MPTRDLSNKRIYAALGTANSVIDLSKLTLLEAQAMQPAHEAIRFDGYDYGVAESDEVDDRSLADDAGAVLAGFAQFGGAIPFYVPKKADQGSVVKKVWLIIKKTRTELIFLERVGWKDNTLPLAAGDDVNVSRMMTDSYMPDTEGTGGYVYVINMLPKGDVYPWYILPSATPEPIVLVGAATAALTVGTATLRGAKYFTSDITGRATWTSSNPAVATVDQNGVIVGVSAGSATIVPSYPGAAVNAGIAVTVSAA
jgi:hypothetical protein